MPVWISVRETGTEVGRGAFAERAFEIGEVVEICPVIPIDTALNELPEPVRRLLFNWPEDQYALALGYGSIYNHADDPNLSFSKDLQTSTITFTARKQIQSGDQLTISYNQVMEGDRPKKKDWFKANMIEKLNLDEFNQS